MNYFKSTFPIFSPSREAICSQWRSGWISFSIKVCKEIWSCTDEPNKPRLFLEFTLIPGSFRFSKKLGYGNMSRDIQTCNERSDWTGLDSTRNFLVWISFLVELHFVKNLSLINSDMYTTLLSSANCYFCCYCCFFLKINFTSQSGVSLEESISDKMKRAIAFGLTVTVIERWGEILDGQELPWLFWQVCHFVLSRLRCCLPGDL